ncbi:MAG TPA: ABC transporter ATP-binding protein, partial [Vicinamibacteria bacterium]|nr:ABC transporter ATP-binding protein [Vicinamibacteria bacterium]
MSAWVKTIVWPAERLGEGIEALARASGLSRRRVMTGAPEKGLDPEELSEWIVATSSWLGLEAEPVELLYRDADSFLRASGPSVVRLPQESGFLLLLRPTRRTNRKHVRVLGNDHAERSLSIGALKALLSRRFESSASTGVEEMLSQVGLSGARLRTMRGALLRERLNRERVGDGWLLRLSPGSSFAEQAFKARLPQNLLLFVGAYTIDYLLWVLSWWLLAQGALEGRLDWGWLLAWALLFVTMLPFRMIATWFEGRFAVGAGGLLKQRLVQGALRLEPEEVRQDGVGHHLGRVIESEAVETLALSGGFLSVAAVIELVVAGVILSAGAGGLVHALLLVGWLGVTSILGWRYVQTRTAWTRERLSMSHELIERMVGHRTRLAQLQPDEWHEDEDRALTRYLDSSRAMDRDAACLAVVPRGWLALGLLGLGPAFVSGEASLGLVAAGLGGTILAQRALKKLVDGLSFATGAAIAWRQVAFLFRAAARDEPAGDPTLRFRKHTLAAIADEREPNGRPILEATDLVFRYATRAEPVLRGCSLQVNQGDRVLVESPSGGGKSTLVSLLNGLRAADSGLLLLHGLDRRSLGPEGWARTIACAPQFHENHVITETFAFNLLMGRRWPPRAEDMEEAESLCRELGLGDLLDHMPAGMLQMVGES